MTDYAPGSFFSAQFDKPRFSLVTGIDGDSARVRNTTRSGKIVVTLQQSSLSNNWLSSFNIADETLGAGVLPFFAREKGGGTTIFAASAFVQEVPQINLSINPMDRSWTFLTDNLFLYLGGLPKAKKAVLPQSFKTDPKADAGIPVFVEIEKNDGTSESATLF